MDSQLSLSVLQQQLKNPDTKSEILNALLKRAGKWIDGAEEDVRNFFVDVLQSIVEAEAVGDEARVEELQDQIEVLMNTNGVRLKRQGISALLEIIVIALKGAFL